jgi:hypothetical protein
MSFGSALKDVLMGEKAKTQVGDLIIDGCTTFTPTYECEMTEHPIESGCVVTDHVKIFPQVVQLEGVLSAATLETGYPGQTTVNAFKDLATGADHVKEALSLLESYVGKQVDIINSKVNLKDMTVLSFIPSQSNQTAGMIYFTLSAKKLVIVSTAKSGLVAMAEQASEEVTSDGSKAKTKQAKKKTDTGKNTNTQASTSDTGKNESTLHGFFN